MKLTTLVQAFAAFAITNIDDIVVLAVIFGEAGARRAAALRVVLGQYLGFVAILAVSVSGARLGTRFLPPSVLPYLGILPIALGLRAAWHSWNQHRRAACADESPTPPKLGVADVAAITFANGTDNIGVYIPIFASSTSATVGGYIVVFLAGVALWCAAGRAIASYSLVADALSRWGDIVLPVALVSIGLIILLSGGAFGR